MEEIINKIQEIQKWIKANKELPDFQNNDNKYMSFAVEMGNHLRYLMLVSASLRHEGQDGYNKEDAVIGGLFVRLYKLYDTLCFHVAENHGEIVQIFVRLIFETSKTLEYLIENGKTSIENFIFISYKATKEQYEDLLDKKFSRELSKIEQRILSNIERQFKEDKIDIKKLLKNKNWKLDGKVFKDRLKDKFAYSYVFASASSNVHGDWRDLIANHLIYKNGVYFPNLEHDSVDPRYICPMSIACLNALVKFLTWNNTDPDEFIISTAKELENLVRKFDADHERALQKAYQK